VYVSLRDPFVNYFEILGGFRDLGEPKNNRRSPTGGHVSRMSRECVRFNSKFRMGETPERAFACPFRQRSKLAVICVNLMRILEGAPASPYGHEISIFRFVFHVKRGRYLTFKATSRSFFASVSNYIYVLFPLIRIESRRIKIFDLIKFMKSR